MLPGFLRKLNKNISSILQAVLIICIIHYAGQGFLVKIQKKLSLGSHNGHQNVNRLVPPRHIAPRPHKSSHGGHAGSRIRNAPPRRKMVKSSTTTTTTTTPVPVPPHEVLMQLQKEKLDQLWSTCSKWRQGLWQDATGDSLTEEEKILAKPVFSYMPRIPAYQMLLTSERLGLAFCPIRRTGASWVAKRLLVASGNYKEEELYKLSQPTLELARRQYPFLKAWEDYPIFLRNATTMLITRHPVDRLIASYRHTLEDAKKNYQGYVKYGKRISRMMRQGETHWKSREPTFREFVQYLLERDIRYFDDEWQPLTRRCTPCHIPFNVILQYETLWNDAHYAWGQTPSVKPINTTDYVTYSLTPDSKVKYVSQLTSKELMSLYHRYQLDFDLFGYTLDDYLPYTMSKEEGETKELTSSSGGNGTVIKTQASAGVAKGEEVPPQDGMNDPNDNGGEDADAEEALPDTVIGVRGEIDEDSVKEEDEEGEGEGEEEETQDAQPQQEHEITENEV
ncbi:carbohydrate sulfotransferase 14-like [Oratosquilla oratoria]|uniref:carbohydrate sulfotransferase 14-like n=1 Tax=Oratosquilla oratoria TaxID=337810 RepID=UPI003F759B9D